MRVSTGMHGAVRTPGLTGKMKESWTRLFKVLRRVTAVNVELGLLGRSKKKCRVVHVNTIKHYHQPDCRVLRDMVVAEYPDELPLKPVLAGDQLMEAQTTQLQQILEGAEGTFRDEPGLTTGCENHIKTGDALPIRWVPYAISPKKLEGIRKEISLLEKGIIVPSKASGPRPMLERERLNTTPRWTSARGSIRCLKHKKTERRQHS